MRSIIGMRYRTSSWPLALNAGLAGLRTPGPPGPRRSRPRRLWGLRRCGGRGPSPVPAAACRRGGRWAHWAGRTGPRVARLVQRRHRRKPLGLAGSPVVDPSDHGRDACWANRRGSRAAAPPRRAPRTRAGPIWLPPSPPAAVNCARGRFAVPASRPRPAPAQASGCKLNRSAGL